MSVFIRNPRIKSKVDKAVRASLRDGGEVVRDEVKSLIDTSGGGEDWRNLPHTSSAPGEPPTSQSGELRDSINTSDVMEVFNGASVRVGSNVLYARFMELGTKHTAPRPFLRPGLAQSKDKVLAQFTGRLGNNSGGAA